MDVLFIIACFTAGLAICAPLILFAWAWSVVKYSPYPYCFNLLSSASWIVYGSRHHNTPACVINGAGVLANAVYMAAFLHFSARADHRRRYLICFMVGAIVVFAVIALVDVAGCHDLYDGLCSLVSVLVSLAPFINLLLVPRERLREAMPAPLVPATALLNAALWTGRNTAGVPLHDINLHLVIPSATAALCAFLLLAIHFVFKIQGPPPLPTGVYETLLLQNQNERDRAAGHEGELRLDVDNSTITEGANHVPAPTDVIKALISQCQKKEDGGARRGDKIRPEVNSSSSNIAIVERSPEDANRVPATPRPTDFLKALISQCEKKEDGGAGPRGKLRLDVNSSTDNGKVAIVDTSPGDDNGVPATLLHTDILKALMSQREEEDGGGARRGGKLKLDAKPAEEGHAGNAMVDHTPVGKSTTKDKEPAEPHEDGAAA